MFLWKKLLYRIIIYPPLKLLDRVKLGLQQKSAIFFNQIQRIIVFLCVFIHLFIQPFFSLELKKIHFLKVKDDQWQKVLQVTEQCETYIPNEGKCVNFPIDLNHQFSLHN